MERGRKQNKLYKTEILQMPICRDEESKMCVIDIECNFE